MTEEKLKLCPFCGEKLEVDIDDEYGAVSIRHAKCVDCVMHDIEDVEMPIGSTIDDLINKVNIRPIEDALRARAEVAEERVYRLRNMLLLLLDQLDYTTGACRANELVGAVLGVNLIQIAHEILKGIDNPMTSDGVQLIPYLIQEKGGEK